MCMRHSEIFQIGFAPEAIVFCAVADNTRPIKSTVMKLCRAQEKKKIRTRFKQVSFEASEFRLSLPSAQTPSVRPVTALCVAAYDAGSAVEECGR